MSPLAWFRTLAASSARRMSAEFFCRIPDNRRGSAVFKSSSASADVFGKNARVAQEARAIDTSSFLEAVVLLLLRHAIKQGIPGSSRYSCVPR